MKKLSTYVDKKLIGVKNKMNSLFQRKAPGINGIVIEVGLLVVGIALLFIFKEQIGTFITNLITTCTNKLNGMFTT